MIEDYRLEMLVKPVTELYADLETALIKNIARRIAETKIITSSAQYELDKLDAMGSLTAENIKEISRVSKMAEQVIKELLEKAGYESLQADEKIYNKAFRHGALNASAVPLGKSPILNNILEASYKNALNVFNLTNTKALTASQNIFLNSVNLAYIKVATGSFTREEAVRYTVKEMASAGIYSVDYSRRKDKIDVAVRRNIITSVNQMNGRLTVARAGEWGNNLVQVSKHMGSRPSHAVWQGKIYSLVGGTAEYPNLADVTGYGTPGGLMGINCRHRFWVYIPGISPVYNADFDMKRNDEFYKLTQEQRRIEREIRKYKRELAALTAANEDASEAKTMVLRAQKEMREFIERSGLRRQPAREQVA